MSVVIGMDIGGTSVKLGAWRGAERLAWHDGRAVPEVADESGIADLLAQYVREISAGISAQPALLGIGSCGLISAGVILQSPNTAWDHLSLTALMTDRLKMPTYLLNDADAFLLAALDTLADRRCVALGITLGTGIGTAVWLEDHLLQGGSGISPEGGHLTISMDCPPANTGIPGSWESLGGREALLRNYSNTGQAAGDPREIAEAARAGDTRAIQAWRQYGGNVGAGLGSLCNLFSPQHVLIGGGMAGAHKLFEQDMFSAVQVHMLAALPRPKIQFIEDAADLVAKGSARFAMLQNEATAV